MSSKIKKWNFGKLCISNGAGCSGCNKPNLADIVEPKPKIPIQTNPSSNNICHTSTNSCEINGHVYSMADDKNDDFDQDDQTSTTFSIDISSLSPPSSYQNENNLSQSEANSGSRVCTCPEIDNTIVVVTNSDDPFQDNHTSKPFSITNIDSLSALNFDQNYGTNFSQSETNSKVKISTCQKIDVGLIVAKNLDDPFHDHHTSVTLSNKTKPLSPPKSKQNDDINLSQIEVNSESKVNTCSKIGSSLALVKNLDNPFHDNHTCPTHSFNTKLLSPPSSNQNACTNLSQSETNSESKTDTCPKTSNTLAVVINSDDPFQDFKKSMLQMISEKEIYSSEDLEELLNYFLKLNSPSHHYIIIQAFMEILNND
ncbi:hypothetical protein P3S68_001560 [Capsicum galapagoense]